MYSERGSRPPANAALHVQADGLSVVDVQVGDFEVA